MRLHVGKFTTPFTIYPLFFSYGRESRLWEKGDNLNQYEYMEDHDPHCPSCTEELESCGHVLMCEEEERLDALGQSIGWLDDWLKKVGKNLNYER